jgi:hypothetical protein
MPSGRPKKYCKCGCGERLDTLPNYTKQRRYINTAHCNEAAHQRPYTAPIRRHRLIVAVDLLTQSKKLIGVSVHIEDPVLIA